MNQNVQAIRLVKIRTIAILTSLGLATALLLTVIFSQTSHALILDKLLPQTNQALTGVVNQVLSPPQLPTPPRSPVANPHQAPQSSPVVQAPAAQVESSAPASDLSVSSSPQATETIPLMDAKLQSIEFLPASYSDTRSNSKPTIHFAFASPQKRLLLLEPTDRGWQFMGLLWYWWIAIAAGAAGLIVFWKRKGEQLSYQILSWRNTAYVD